MLWVNDMGQSITVILPADLKRALDDFTRKEGIPPDELIGQAIREHLFLRQLRSLQARMAAKAQSQGVVTDQDVFDRVS